MLNQTNVCQLHAKMGQSALICMLTTNVPVCLVGSVELNNFQASLYLVAIRLHRTEL